MSARGRVLDVPFGDAGLLVDASPERPVTITAVGDDLHLSDGSLALETLFAGRSLRVEAPTTVRRPDGHATTVRVLKHRAAR